MQLSVRTSITHPLTVSWLEPPHQHTPTPGRLGVTLAPGRRSTSTRGFRWERDLHRDLTALQLEYHVDTLVSLVPPDEARAIGIHTLPEQCRTRSLEHHHLPIPDGGVPAPSQRAAYDALIHHIVTALAASKTVVIHCQAGLGRAGTLAGCTLVALGLTPDEALHQLSTRRSPRCPENQRQRDFIRTFETRHKVTGAILAAAIGDALGAPTEFMSMAAIHDRFGPTGVTGFERWRTDSTGHRFAPYTDDTQLAEVVSRALVAMPPGEDLDALMARMAPAIADWSVNPLGGHRAPGNACMNGARRLGRGVPWRDGGAPGAGGCGSAMRAWPFGLAFRDHALRDHTVRDHTLRDHAVRDHEEQALTWAAEHSRSTHGHPLALAACAAIAAGTSRALHGTEPEAVVAGMVDAAARYHRTTSEMIAQAALEATQGITPDVTLDRLRGWAGHEAVAAAAYVFLRHPDDPKTALLEGANTPGDSDSIASLTGALVGARCGFTALPMAWVADVERSEELRELAAAHCDGASA